MCQQWQRLKKVEKLFVITLSLAFVAAIVTGITLCIGKKKYISKKERIGRSIQAAMNSSVDPCHDFYEFTCGNWASQDFGTTNNELNQFSILQTKVYISLKEAFDQKLKETNLGPAQEKLIQAYKSCITNNKGIGELQNLLKEIGGWPMGDKDWNENEYGIDISIATAIRKTGSTPLIEFGVIPNLRNTRRNIITFIEPSIMKSNLHDKDRKNLLISIAKQFPNHPVTRLESDIQDMIALENELRRILIKSFHGGLDDNYYLCKIKDLKTAIKGIDLTEILQVITNSTLDKSKYLKKEDKIAIYNLVYMESLAKLIQSNQYSLKTYANYIGTHIVLKYSRLVQSTFSARRYFNQWLYKQNSKATNTWFYCLDILSKQLNYVTDRVYIDYLGDTSKYDVKKKEMLDHIILAFQIIANQSTWLDDITLTPVIEKLHAMRKHIGYPHWILDDRKLDKYYKTLPRMNSNFSSNIMTISEFLIERSLNQLNELGTLDEWPNSFGLASTVVNAFYVRPYNAIIFPLAIQNPPFYDQDLPWYLNFGAIGTVIGHEITHGFQNAGSSTDKDGNIHNWWSPQSINDFYQRSQCFVYQYNSYFNEQTKLSVNGTLTLMENIADGGGLRQAYLAYQMWEKEFGKEPPLPGLEKYTPHQLFFIAYGYLWCAKYGTSRLKTILKEEEHTPLPYRVWGAISNSEEFARAFNCSKGTKMNPRNKCIIW